MFRIIFIRLEILLLLVIQNVFIQPATGACGNFISTSVLQGYLNYRGTYHDCTWKLPDFQDQNYALLIKVANVSVTYISKDGTSLCSGILKLPGLSESCRYSDSCHLYTKRSPTCIVEKVVSNGCNRQTFTTLPREMTLKWLYAKEKSFLITYKYIRCPVEDVQDDAQTTVGRQKIADAATTQQTSTAAFWSKQTTDNVISTSQKASMGLFPSLTSIPEAQAIPLVVFIAVSAGSGFLLIVCVIVLFCLCRKYKERASQNSSPPVQHETTQRFELESKQDFATDSSFSDDFGSEPDLFKYPENLGYQNAYA